MKKLLCGLLCLSMVFAATACTSQTPPAQSSSSSSAASSSQASSAAPSAEASSSSFSSEPTYSYHTIAGSHVTDISMGLDETFDIPRADILSSKDLSVSKHYGSSLYTEPTTELDFSYHYSCGENYEIIQADFSIMNAFQLISQEDFYKVATAYLSFCSTMPYTSSDIDAAKKFVEDNIKSAPVDGVSTQIGDAVFSLYSIKDDNGNCTVANLSIVAEGLASPPQL